MATSQLKTAAQAVERANNQIIAGLRSGRDAIEYYVANNLVDQLPASDSDLVHNDVGAQTRREFLDQLELLATTAKTLLGEGSGGNTLLGGPSLSTTEARDAVKKLGL